jgi:hypothetical protein
MTPKYRPSGQPRHRRRLLRPQCPIASHLLPTSKQKCSGKETTNVSACMAEPRHIQPFPHNVCAYGLTAASNLALGSSSFAGGGACHVSVMLVGAYASTCMCICNTPALPCEGRQSHEEQACLPAQTLKSRLGMVVGVFQVRVVQGGETPRPNKRKRGRRTRERKSSGMPSCVSKRCPSATCTRE